MKMPPAATRFGLALTLALILAGPGSSQTGRGAAARGEITTDPLSLDLSGVSPAQRRLILQRMDAAGALVERRNEGELVVDRTPALEILRQLEQAGIIPVSDRNLVRARLFDLPTDFLRRIVEVQQTHEPQVSAQIILRDRMLALNECGRQPSGTRRAQCVQGVNDQYRELSLAASRMMAADPNDECGRAAKAYGETVLQCGDGSCPALENTLRTQGAAVDRACLATVESLPAASTADLKHVAIIEAEIEGAYQPICGGLFLASTKILTAHHCFEPQRYRRLVAAGKVRVRAATGAATDSWRLQAFDPVVMADLDSPRTATGDYLIVSTVGGPALPAAPALNQQADVTEAVVIGHFRHFDPRRATNPAPPVAGISLDPNWRAGLRFSKPGTCWVVGRAPACVRLYCQTIPGFSGTPIFHAGGSSSGRLMGLVSRRADDGDSCEAPGTLQGLTIGAVPPAALLQGHASAGGRLTGSTRGTKR